MSSTDTGTSKGTQGVLLVTCLSTLVVNANTSAVSILLPAISTDTGMSVTTLQWAVTGYSLVGAATIVTSGSLGDVFGRKRIFQLGLLLFIASCVLIALSGSGGMVIAGRAIQGAAGATILACGLSLLSVANRGKAQLRAVSLWGAAAAVGAAAGPLLGGVLVELTGWQALFWVDAGVAVVCMLIAAASVAESRDSSRSRSIDMWGSLLVAITLMPLILALSKGSDWGWASVATLGCLAVAIGAGIAFVAVERRVAVPMLDLALLRNRVLVGSTIAILIGSGTINGLMYLVSLYFQNPQALGYSPLQAGLATLPATAGLVVVAPFVPALGSTVRRPSGRRRRVRDYRRRVRGDRLRRGVMAVHGLRPTARCRRHRNGTLQRAGIVGGDGLSVGNSGRGSIRCLQHGTLCRCRSGDGARSVDLRQRDRRQDSGRTVGRRRTGRRTRRSLLGDGSNQCRRCRDGRGHGSPPRCPRHPGRRGRGSSGPHPHTADLSHARRHTDRSPLAPTGVFSRQPWEWVWGSEPAWGVARCSGWAPELGWLLVCC